MGPHRTHLAAAAGLSAAAALLAAALPAAAASEAVPGAAVLVGRLHPALVHFPFALVIAAGLLEAGRLVTRRSSGSSAAIACLAFAVPGAALAVIAGLLNAQFEPHGRGVAPLIDSHRLAGYVTAGLAGAALAAGLFTIRRPGVVISSLYRGVTLTAAVAVVFTAHLGSTVVRGEGHLLGPARSAVPSPAAVPQGTSPAAPLVDSAVVAIFESRCTECHGAAKRRGNLRLDDPRALFAGVPEEWVVIPGDAAASELVRRVSLPPDDRDRMPPRGERLTAEEFALITRWIHEGAGWDPAAASDAPLETTAGPGPGNSWTAAEIEAIHALRESGGRVEPIAAGAADLSVNLSVAAGRIDDARLVPLAALAGRIVELDLSRTAITDGGMGVVSACSRVQLLRLAETAVGDSGISRLDALVFVRSINLVGTRVTDAGAAALARLPALRMVYLGGSAVTAEGVEDLRSLRPDVVIHTGGPTLDTPGPPGGP